MRVSSILSALPGVLIATAVVAAPTEFPYKAVVKDDGVVVRSGPGERYDPTLKLNTGQQVTVHRHDPGGWFMISPPAGSFSLIDAAYVEKTGPQTGVVKVPSGGDGLPARVVVWIGSQFTDEHKYTGRQLADGDEVQILGEKQGTDEGGTARFYKIAPPRLEYRWVKGDFIVPLSKAGQIARSTPAPVTTPPVANTPEQARPEQTNPVSNPFDTSALPAPGFPPERPEQGPTLLERELRRSTGSGAVRQTPVEPASTAAERTELYALDDQLKAMLARTPDHWDLDGMDQAYRQLQSRSGVSVASQIDSRLATIGARRKVKDEFDAFVGVITRTEQRDKALMSMQQQLASGVPPEALQTTLGQPGNMPPQAGETHTPAVNGVQPPSSLRSPASSGGAAVPGGQRVPSMDGAGIVQRIQPPVPGLPDHVLVAPNGKLLAYLKAGQGVQLDNYVGQPMGVIGNRSHDAQLKSDLIVVERLTPVRLQPSPATGPATGPPTPGR